MKLALIRLSVSLFSLLASPLNSVALANPSLEIPDLPASYASEFSSQFEFEIKVKTHSPDYVYMTGPSLLRDKLAYCSVKIGGATFVLRTHVLKPEIPLRLDGETLVLREPGTLKPIYTSDLDATNAMEALRYVAQFGNAFGAYAQVVCEKSEVWGGLKRFSISVQFEDQPPEIDCDENPRACEPDFEWD